MSHHLIGSTLGNYKLEKVLRNTPTGQVFLAHHPSTNMHVEVKVVLDDKDADPKLRERLERELQTLTRINHPNAVRTWAVGRDGAVSYVVTEHIDGRPLKSWLEELGRLRWQDALRVFIHVMRGLEAIHSFNVVHRDITPENILLGNDGRVVVADFSSVKLVGSDGAATNTAVASDFLGNLYISPEQLSGEQVDARTDIYCAGMCLYHALAARLPFETKGGISTLLQRLNVEPKPLRELVPDVPAPVEATVMRCIAAEPDERFASATEARKALEKLVRR